MIILDLKTPASLYCILQKEARRMRLIQSHLWACAYMPKYIDILA